MIIKHLLLRNFVVDDVECKKTHEQIQQERNGEDKRLNDESALAGQTIIIRGPNKHFSLKNACFYGVLLKVPAKESF